MSQSDKPFSVNDRRHFTPEGQARRGAEEPAETAEAPRPEAAADPGREETPPVGQAPAAGPGGGPVDFSQFLLSLGAQAGMLLSGQAEGEEPGDALDHARSIISILEMLEDKTRGRRTDDESRLLEELLYQLRMAYVEKTRERK
jgi:hypothetical protein